MSNRITKVIALVGASGALAFSGIGVAQAKNGADDPAGQHREHDGVVHARQSADDNGRFDNRGGKYEAGDDSRARRGVEPGDDNGAGIQIGDDSGGHGGRL